MPTLNRNIISCHYCAAEGIKQNLAELLPNGIIKIPRHDVFEGDHWEREYTAISGENFKVICVKCGNVAYEKGGQNEVSSVGEQGVFRFTLVNTVIKFGTPGITDYAGTFI